MSNEKIPASYPSSDRAAERPSNASQPAAPRGPAADPFSPEDIDGQIRWFFENSGEPSRPRV